MRTSTSYTQLRVRIYTLGSSVKKKNWLYTQIKMKRFLLLLVVSISLTSLSFVQAIEIPKWIVGTWSNTAESNTENKETFIFTTNKIYFIKGLSFIKSKKD